MLTLQDTIEQRRAIRRFAPDDVSEGMVTQVLEAARRAPSASNTQPWRFLVVRDPETRKKLSKICMEQKFIEEAPVVIIAFGDLDRYSHDARRIRRAEFDASGVSATLSGKFADPKFKEYFDNLPLPPREQLAAMANANVYIAVTHLILTAAALGLGTCWVGTSAENKKFNRLFDLPDHLVPAAVIPLGYPAGDLPPARPRLPMEEILVTPGKDSAPV